MESLPTLDTDEIVSLAPIVIGADAKAFKSKARFILDGVDAPSSAAILAALPSTGDRSFMSDVKAALKDADPDVRSAAVRALADFQEDKALTAGGMDLLRDPVERVRIAAASAIAEAGGTAVVQKLSGVLDDENEMDEVKASLIKGLGRASNQASLDLLIDELGSREAWTQRTRRGPDFAFLHKGHGQDTGTFQGRHRGTEIAHSRKRARDGQARRGSPRRASQGGNRVAEAIHRRSAGIARIRRGANPGTEAPGSGRSGARPASSLSLVGSRAAYRGIVLAARDPDTDVRVAVTRALERLAGAEGAKMLTDLEHDPDSRVTKVRAVGHGTGQGQDAVGRLLATMSGTPDQPGSTG